MRTSRAVAILTSLILSAAVCARALAEDVKISLPERIKTTTVRFGTTQTYNRWVVNLTDIPDYASKNVLPQILDPEHWKIEYTVPNNREVFLAKIQGIEGSEGSSKFFFKMAWPRNATVKQITITIRYPKAGTPGAIEDVPYVLQYKDKSSDVIDYSTQTPDPLSFDVLGLAKEATMLDGSTKESYRARMNLDLGSLFDSGHQFALTSTLSTKSDDREAKFDLTWNRRAYGTGPTYSYFDPTIQFSGNQAFTNTSIGAQLNLIQYGAPLFPRRRSYDDAPADWTIATFGVAYMHMLRTDPRISATSDKNAAYGVFNLNSPSAYFASGFGQLNLNLSAFVFDNKTRQDFGGLHTLEGYIDANLLIPVIRPTQDRDGKWSGGTWAKVAWQSGVVRENAFARSSGLTYGLSIEFKF